ncbi:PadR family transcriptional regulator [Microbacterium sp. CFBP9034]|uniref:PadR family transcriptional regulator n=1 Tax=Microbacterium sp. CFBP9034 TaxID=3096540 RepID=UPI002A69E992|nr:helix-turn-helix transcriptional regulator [Microbacterium sp. CFBP9034]MDY0908426.1 helix-turn-helix transcriptional regulator [Microbacterium sp. CFBP9034]
MTAQLTPPVFWILTCLASERRHGYDILRATEEASGGEVSLRVTSLYAALERMERDGLIVVDGEETVNGRARRYFRISPAGSERLDQEVTRMEQAARAARASMARRAPVFGAPMAVRP